jgi:hypothetical protein
MGLAVAAVVVLAARGPSAQAQPVASITLPAPGAAKQLYPGCNNIGLTFANGTASQDVVQAVTPAGSVESVWRHNAALNKFVGFSPQYPQVSDLLTVDFLDAVWFCMTTGAPPGGVAPPGPTATATPPGGAQPPPGGTQPPPGGSQPPPAALTADVGPTDLYPDNQPQGVVWVRITNNGPGTLANHKVDLTVVETKSTLGNPPSAQSAQGPAAEYTLNLAPGQTQNINLGLQFDLSQFNYQYAVSVVAKDFTDSNPTNDGYTEAFTAVPPPVPPGGGSWGVTKADLAVTDLFLKSMPIGSADIWSRLTNNGPDTVSNVSVNQACSLESGPVSMGGTKTYAANAWPITITLNPGQTGEFSTGFQASMLPQFYYKVTCSVTAPFNDPNPSNNTYKKTFP